MFLDILKNKLVELGIKKNDTVFVSSDILMLLYDSIKEKQKITADEIINILQELIGENGNLIFPTYNWGFCKGETFDYKNTPSQTGTLSQIALNRKDFKRTKHPIYSFAVWGKNTEDLTSLEYKSSFGKGSVFEWFYKHNAKNLFINVSYQNSATFVHSLEEKCNVKYRFLKEFTSKYIDEQGHIENKTYSMYVRYLDKPISATINPMHEIFLKENCVQESKLGHSFLRLLDMKKAYDLVEYNILHHHSDRVAKYDGQDGEIMYDLLKDLFPICRSLSGNGNRQTLKKLQEIVPELQIHEVPTGTQVFDWTIPKEWNIRDAWIKNSNGEKIIDFKETNLHVMGYSTPIHKKINLKNLLDIVYTLPEQPELIPYVTSYYKERYGFCMSENLKNSLVEDEYEIFIDSDLKEGSLTYGDILIKGEEEKEILIDTYICHPSMANNELSGPAVAIHLAKWLKERKNNRYTYRFTFVPETIGALAYLKEHIDTMKKNTVAGFVLTCIGDEKTYSYIESPYANTLADKVAKNILKYHYPNYEVYKYLERGSNERQYCSSNANLPVCSITRSKYGKYPEYHTSADNLTFVTGKGLQGSFNLYKKIIIALENNYKYKINVTGEPQLGKRGLYSTISKKNSADATRNMMNFIAYANGENDLIDISNIINTNIEDLIPIIKNLEDAGLLDKNK